LLPTGLFAQFWGRGSDQGGIVAVASPAKAGRVITVGGRLNPIRKIAHSLPVEGYVEALFVSPGKRVTKGEELLQINREVIGESFRPVYLTARIDGLVSQIHVYSKEEVRSGTLGITIIDDSRFSLSASLSDRDSQGVKALIGQRVSGKNSQDEEFQGIIRSLSPEPDYETGLFTLHLEFPPQRGLTLGTVLFVDLPVEKPQGITVEKTALFTEGEQTFLWLLGKDNTLTKQEVTLGKENRETFEIPNGLTQGDRYIREIGGNEEAGLSLKDLIQRNMRGN